MSKLFSITQLKNYITATNYSKFSICKYDPVTVCLFVTDRCTLSCQWCLRQIDKDFTLKVRNDMSLETAQRILQYFPRATHLSLAGFGEPLLVDDLFKIVSAFKKRPMRTGIITNGTLLYDRVDEVIKTGLHRISISINSLDSEDYQKTCGGNENTFNNVIKGIQTLIKKRNSKPLVQLSFVLTRDIIDRAPEIVKFAEELKVDQLDFHNLIQHKDVNDYSGMLTSDDVEVFARLTEWSKQKYKIKVVWPKLIQKELKKPSRLCTSLWGWLGVDMDGNTAGCSKVMATEMKYGNLFQVGTDVWNNEFRKMLRENFINREFHLDCCKACTEVQP